jgi:homoserine kinase
LGSSASAIIGGVLISDFILNLDLTSSEILDLATLVEGHPDNISGSMFGLTISFLNCEIPEFNPDWFLPNSKPIHPQEIIKKHNRENSQISSIVNYTILKMNENIYKLAIVPDFELSTAAARKVLPPLYKIKDLVYNLGRCATLCQYLQAEPTSNIYECFKDKLHQRYRADLVPGLIEIIDLNPGNCKGYVVTN